MLPLMFSYRNAILIIVTCFCLHVLGRISTNRKECDGFSSRSTYSDTDDYIGKLRGLAGCKVVLRNLIIYGVTDSIINQSDFNNALNEIEEVYGYVEISFNELQGEILLPMLRIIRGLETYVAKNAQNDLKMALLIIANKVKYVALPKLSAVLEHTVVIGNNTGLDCQFGSSIDATEFLGHDLERFINSFDQYTANCSCHHSCSPGRYGKRYCWGPRQDQCQPIIRSCRGKCSGIGNKNTGLDISYYTDEETNETMCCDDECATGCSRPGPDNCNDCLHYKDKRTQYCVRRCEPLDIITPEHKLIKNPLGQYIEQRSCVSRCQKNWVIHGQYCLTECPAGYKREGLNHDRMTCEKCEDDDDCFGSCAGDMPYVTSTNIAKFRGCRKVNGSLEIITSLFFKETHDGSKSIISYLKDNLGDIEIITGSLTIQYKSSVPMLSLSFLSNLRIVEGKSVKIYAPNLVELGLPRLKEVRHGNVNLTVSNEFCYGFDLPWDSKIIRDGRLKIYDEYGSLLDNQDIQRKCELKNTTCSTACNQNDGCYGPGIRQCYQCENYTLTQDGKLDICQAECNSNDGFFQIDGNACGKCHELCSVRIGSETCTGTRSTQCLKCEYARLQRTNECVSSCPTGTFIQNPINSNEDAFCLDCDPVCGNLGCNGPEKLLIRKEVKYGCNSCADLAIRSTEIDGFVCMNRNYTSKPEMTISQYCRKFIRPTLHQTIRNDLKHKIVDHGYVCEECSSKCKRCTDDGEKLTLADSDLGFIGCECKNAIKLTNSYHGNHTCIDSCNDRSFYPVLGHEYRKHGFDICESCDVECDGCYGPTNRECIKCRHFEFHYDSNNTVFECVAKCPKSKPLHFKNVCSAEHVTAGLKLELGRTKLIAVICGVTLAVVLGILLTIVCKYRHQIQFYRALEKGEKINLHAITTKSRADWKQPDTLSSDQLLKPTSN